jgi:hypothetical protein
LTALLATLYGPNLSTSKEATGAEFLRTQAEKSRNIKAEHQFRID